MRVIAIDPGFGRCGIAILEKEKGAERVVHSACIETPAKKDFPDRLAQVADECARVITKHKPSALAMEKLFFNSNQKTALQVAEVRGAILLVASQHKLPVFEYTPGQVKLATSGYGRADKRAIASMIHSLVSIEKEIEFDDEYDAIAVGITHLAHAR